MSDKEIVFYLDGKEVDSIDPYYVHVEKDEGLEVDGGGGTYLILYKDFDRYEIIYMRKRPLE